MEIRSDELSWPSMYKLLTGSVVPRPIGWVSTLNAQGQPNLAPFSFFNVVCPYPAHLLFCPQIRGTDGGEKDTLVNIRASGEFVFNIVTEELLPAMNQTSTELPVDVDEFQVANLITAPSVRVKPPRVAASPIHFECRLAHILDFGDGQPGGGSVVIGEVLQIHVRDDLLIGSDKIDVNKLRPVGRLAGPQYSRVNEVIELVRPPSRLNINSPEINPPDKE